MELDSDLIKQYSWHTKVLGAYVQDPRPSIVGLADDEVVGSNDAAALYPTGIIYGNIGFDTIRDRIYDSAIINRLIFLIEKTFREKHQNPNIVEDAVSGFQNALHSLLRDYFKRKAVKNKKDAEQVTLNLYPKLLKRILSYEGNIEDIYSPKTDEEYYLLKSCLFPLIETVTWLNPQNRGYNQTIVDYVFFHDDFLKREDDVFYLFTEINSVKTKFVKLNKDDVVRHFKTRILNPYGVLFDRHCDNLAYDVELLKEALSKRRVIKNQMLVLETLKEHWDKLSQESLDIINNLGDEEALSKTAADRILTEIHDTEDRTKRIEHLTEVKWFFQKIKLDPYSFVSLRISQLNIVQLGIKVAANSAYGIFGLITWPFASPLIGNAITNAGKIYGIKLFQYVSVEVLNQRKENFNNERN
jgi:DNA polymerase elongation subunit (family B)